MSRNDSESRYLKTKSPLLSGLSMGDLRAVKAAVPNDLRRRSKISEAELPRDLDRSLGKPEELVVHLRPDEGKYPIFDRDDVIANKVPYYEKYSFYFGNRKLYNEKRLQTSQTRSSSTSSDEERGKSLDRRKSPKRHEWKSAKTVEARNVSRRESSPNDNYKRWIVRSSRSKSRSPHKPSSSGSMPKRRLSRSPPSRSLQSSRTPPKYRERSRSPQHREKTYHRSRSPPKRYDDNKYRAPPERKRSRSPRHNRGRSRSPSYYRHNKSPHRRYSRSPDYRSRRRSRSPRRRTRSRSSDRRYKNPMPEDFAFYEGSEFWIPGPPRFIPRGYLPAAPYPKPVLIPRMPILLPPHPPFRPRLPVYNQKYLNPKIMPITSTTITTTPTVAAAAAAAVAVASTSAPRSSGTITSTVTFPTPSTTQNKSEEESKNERPEENGGSSPKT